jgi:hypothetical protein
MAKVVPKTRTAQAVPWRSVLAVHPAAELFPEMAKTEQRELADDIKRNGLQESIVVYDAGPHANPRNYVPDGRNRLDALESIGRETVDINGNPTSPIFTTQQARKCFDPLAFVLTKNLHRRHLTAEQKRELIAKVLKEKPEASNRQIAEQLKVDHHKVASVRAEREATGEIAPVEKTVGKDGKERPAHQRCAQAGKVAAIETTKPDAGARIDPSPSINPTERVAGKGIGFASLSAAMREVEAQWAAGNETRLKGALQRLLKEVSAALAKVRS